MRKLIFICFIISIALLFSLPAFAEKFSVAVIPDTQYEIRVPEARNKNLFKNRLEWIVNEAQGMNLKFIVHTGDVVDFDTDDHFQTKYASEAFTILDQLKIPYTIALGNHDNQSAGPPGGAARNPDPEITRQLTRDTSVFNEFFPVDRFVGFIPFEENKIDNGYTLFTVDGIKFMVLTLELYPRQSMLDMAKKVIEHNSDTNIIIATHAYLTSGGGISTYGGLGDSAPTVIKKQLVDPYPNVKIILCGHENTTVIDRTDIREDGSLSVSLLSAFHSITNNPVQILTIDTRADTLSRRVYIPSDNKDFLEAEKAYENMGFVGAVKEILFPEMKEYSESTFEDISPDEWYAPYVASVYKIGLMNGKSTRMFDPSGTLTVAEAIAMAVRLNDIYNGGDGEFTQGELWYQVYVDYAIENNIIAENQFNSYTREIKRHEIVSMFSKAFPDEWYEPINNIESIPDIDKTKPYHDDVLKLYRAGIITGNDENGTFNPDASLKRSEASAIISRVALKGNRLYKTWS